jgi:hypothetical protein
MMRRTVMNLGLAAAAVSLFLTVAGCTSERPAPEPTIRTDGTEVVGKLVEKQDERAADGGFDLTLEVAPGVTELVRVPSMFVAPPRDSIRVMHEVVEAAQVGDRLRARGTRDETGVLRAEIVELLPTP